MRTVTHFWVQEVTVLLLLLLAQSSKDRAVLGDSNGCIIAYSGTTTTNKEYYKENCH